MASCLQRRRTSKFRAARALVTTASVVKLVAYAQASLTQSAVLRDGGAGAAVLADGASFVQNDANTKIAAAKTGSSLATATAVDVLLSYILEP